MKKLIAGLLLMLITTVSYAKTFQCTAYFNGSQVGDLIEVNASKISVAEIKAFSRFKKIGIKVDYVQCE